MQEFRLTPEMREALRRVAEQIGAAGRAWGEQTREALAAMLPAIEAASEQLRSQFVAIAPSLAGVAATFVEAWDRAIPPNWHEFDAEEIMALMERVRTTGYTLVWIPRAEILREVLAANPDDTASVLLARRDDVLDDAVTCLHDVTDPKLALTREVIEQAIVALRNDLPHPAQAAAASAFTSEIHELFYEEGVKRSVFSKRHEWEAPEEAWISEARILTILAAGKKALDDFDPNLAEPVRHEFNRHNTAHRVTPEQWTEANALSGVMLATALLREMEYLYSARRERADGTNSAGQ